MLDVHPPYNYVRTPAIFLAGGITNCVDWQNRAEELLANLSIKHDQKVVTFNPRRADWDVDDKEVYKEQIAWEHRHLKMADVVLFWFPHETLCPITLFELGKMLGQHKDIVVGCHEKYARRLDLVEQLKLEGYPEPLDNFKELVNKTFETAVNKVGGGCAKNSLSQEAKLLSNIQEIQDKGIRYEGDVSHVMFAFWDLTISQRRDAILAVLSISDIELSLPENERYTAAFSKIALSGQLNEFAKLVSNQYLTNQKNLRAIHS